MKRFVAAAMVAGLAAGAAMAEGPETPSGQSFSFLSFPSDVPVEFDDVGPDAMSGTGRYGEDQNGAVRWERSGSQVTFYWDRGALGERQTACDPWPELEIGNAQRVACFLDGFFTETEISQIGSFYLVTRTQ